MGRVLAIVHECRFVKNFIKEIWAVFNGSLMLHQLPLKLALLQFKYQLRKGESTMTRLEQIEKLREKANVTYEEAQQALDTANGDLLDAIIYLEKQGKVASPQGGGAFSSHAYRTEDVGESQQAAEDDIRKVHKNSITDAIEKIGKFVVAVIDKGNNSFLEILNKDEKKFKVPLTVLALLLLFLPYVTLPLLVIGLIVGYRYRLTGLDFDTEM